MSEKTQYFNGYKFTRSKEGSYYRCAKLKQRMHRYVWEYYNGPIPEGYDIHHIDFDKSNNDISNLQMLPISEHQKLHAQRLTDEQRAWRRENLIKNAGPKSAEWHKSEAGRAWHSEHMRQQHQNECFTRELICTNCGKKYIGKVFGKNSNTFCSGACKSQYRRKSGVDNIERTCVICGKSFMTPKLRPSATCSRSCANRYRWRLKHESEIS